jgi:hypothetical protein
MISYTQFKIIKNQEMQEFFNENMKIAKKHELTQINLNNYRGIFERTVQQQQIRVKGLNFTNNLIFSKHFTNKKHRTGYKSHSYGNTVCRTSLVTGGSGQKSKRAL